MTSIAADDVKSTAASFAGTVSSEPVKGLEREAFERQYRDRNCPVLLTGACAPDSAAWLSRVRASFRPGEAVKTRVYGKERFSLPKTQWTSFCEYQELPFDQYFGMLESGEALEKRAYLAQHSISETLLWKQIEPAFSQISQATGLRPAGHVNLWLGPAGHTEPLHFDAFDGTLLQLAGTKTVCMFHPRQTRNLYPFPIRGGALPPWFSKVDIRRPDYTAFPRLQMSAQKEIRVTLRPGDALFIPAFWWHEVSSEGPGAVCSLNRFYRLESFSRYMMHSRSLVAFLALHPAGRRVLKFLRKR